MKKYAQICKDAGVASQVAGNAIQAALPHAIINSNVHQDIKLGALGAFGAAQLVAAAAALATPTRSNKQQLKAGISPWHTLGNLLVPGMASYNLYKRYGNAMAQESAAAKERDIQGALKATKDKDANVRQAAKAYLKMRKAQA